MPEVFELPGVRKLSDLPDEIVKEGVLLFPPEGLADIGTRAIDVADASHVAADVDGIGEGPMVMLLGAENMLNELAEDPFAMPGEIICNSYVRDRWGVVRDLSLTSFPVTYDMSPLILRSVA